MTDSGVQPPEGGYRVLCGTCPDTQCQTRLFFPAHNSSIECTGCGQRHERNAIKQVRSLTTFWSGPIYTVYKM